MNIKMMIPFNYTFLSSVNERITRRKQFQNSNNMFVFILKKKTSGRTNFTTDFGENFILRKRDEKI